jgi:hypothetical protein
MMRKRRSTTAPPSSTGTTGAAGLPRGSSKSGPAISTANRDSSHLSLF